MNDKTVIIILMYNDNKSTLDLLDYIENNKELEKIIVVDNCSVDDSYEIVKKRETDHIHVIKTESNAGIAAGNNFGVEYAKKICPGVKKYIFSNPDVIIEDGSIISKMSIFLTEHEDAGAVCPMELTREKELAKDFAWRLPTYWQMVLSVLPIHTKFAQRSKKPYLWFYDVKEAVKQDVFWAEVIISCFIMIKREAFEKVGGFSERTFLYHEEDILAHEFAQLGIKLAVLPQCKIVHLGCTSMNKTYKGWEKKSDILFDSSLIYMEDCLQSSKLAIRFYKLMYRFGVLQRKVFRKLTGKEN